MVSAKKNATLGMIAAKAGVSRAVAGCVLLGTGAGVIRVGADTAVRIRKIADTLRYRPNRMAQQLAGRKSQAIGLFLAAQAPQVTSRRAATIEAAASALGYRILVGRFDESQPRLIYDYLADFAGRGIDGIIIIDHAFADRAAMSEIFRDASRQQPAVIQSQSELPPGMYQVALNLQEGTAQAVAHLHARGHRRIGLAINGAETPGKRARELGFRAGLKAAGIPSLDGAIWYAQGGGSTLSREATDALLDQLVDRHSATAIIAANDYWALQLCTRLTERMLRIPQDVAVIGYNNLDFSALTRPALTTFDENEEEVAENLVRYLLTQIDGKPLRPAHRVALVRPRLVVRQST